MKAEYELGLERSTSVTPYFMGKENGSPLSMNESSCPGPSHLKSNAIIHGVTPSEHEGELN